MVKLHFLQPQTVARAIWQYFHNKWFRFKVTIKSLFYNDHLSSSYVADILMEPMLWFVDNFTNFLGPFFIGAVICLTLSVVVLCYMLGVPYWWQRDQGTTVVLMVVGHWLLVNVVFHFYMGCTVGPGRPPEGVFIPEAVSMCKKCIAPKPPRTHHCSVCNRCILKMDHHCPWLNNCVGHWNHRHFFLYMVYTAVGVAFIVVFGVDLFLERVWWMEEELEGHPVRLNNSVLVPVTEPSNAVAEPATDHWTRGAIIYLAFISAGVLIALGSLSAWHARLITRGETSIEANINKTERVRYAALGETYANPYDLGWRRNWAVFFGVEDMTALRAARRVLLPSCHLVRGNGLTWISSFSDHAEFVVSKSR